MFLAPIILPAVLALWAVVALVRRLRSSIAAVPGPKLSLFSSLPFKYHEFNGHRTDHIHDLHKKYGKVVRLAPNEVSFASLDAMKEIYMSNGSGYDKTTFYHLFYQYDTRTMFSTTDRTRSQHTKRRRVIADRYGNTNVMREQAIEGINERSQNFVQKVDEFPGRVMDIYIYLHCYAFDGVTHHLFHPYGSNSIKDESHEFIMREVSFDNSLVRRLLQHYNPSLGYIADRMGLLAPSRSIPQAKELVLDAVKNKESCDSFTLLSRLQDAKFGLADIEMAAECMDHMAAGIETTGDALCWIMWQLSTPACLHMQKKLHEELVSAMADGSEASSFDKLPYLDAVVKEGLRIFPSIPMSLPRMVPKGGRYIDGYYLDEDTIVSCQPYTLHRWDETVFPDPDAFTPERWLETDGDAERNRIFFAFSSGGRGCLGRHLAIAEMKILLRDVYAKFTTSIPDGMEKDMSMGHQIISSRPKDQCCWLKFEPWNS